MDKELGWFHACSSYPLSDLKIKIPIMREKNSGGADLRSSSQFEAAIRSASAISAFISAMSTLSFSSHSSRVRA